MSMIDNSYLPFTSSEGGRFYGEMVGGLYAAVDRQGWTIVWVVY